MDPMIELHVRIMVKALRDAAFRQELLSDPKRALAKELGVGIPSGVEIKVFQDTLTTLHLVLPPDPRALVSGELNDTDLDAVTGGWLAVLLAGDQPQ
ncbi:MAG: NHLP leader peptide family RiPP precursor [Dehalococcoidia bacterium]